MNKYEIILYKLFIAFLCTILDVLFILNIKQFNYDKIINYNFDGFFSILKLSLYVFLIIILSIGAIALTIKIILNIIQVFYYFLFFNEKYEKVIVGVDAEDIIRQGYVEFKDGSTLPIEIRKIEIAKDSNNNESNIQKE